MAGILGLALLVLGLAKWGAFPSRPGGWLGLAVVVTAVVETLLGILLLAMGSRSWVWWVAVLLSAGFSLFAWMGPPLPECFCLGDWLQLTDRARTSLALSFLALSLTGLAADGPAVIRQGGAEAS